jgi:hypothetical protein
VTASVDGLFMTPRLQTTHAFPRFPSTAGRAFALLALLGLLALLAPAGAAAHLSVLRPTPSSPVTFYGHGGYSSDGSYPGHPIRAEVPAGSMVEQAYLYGTYAEYGASTPLGEAERTIDFDGTNVETTEIFAHSEGFPLPSTRADVTAQVAAKVGSGGGITSFEVEQEPGSLGGGISLQGVALVVIYSNPTSPTVSISVLDGGAASAGDIAELSFAAPLKTSEPGFEATLAIGDGFSYQGSENPHECGPAEQNSIIDVDEQRLTSCAGGYDDGELAPEHLITVGGIGDSTNNPTNPLATNEGEDDELYDLTPFLHEGDTHLSVETANPSGDDDVFLAVIEITASASVGTGEEVPPPPPAPEATTAPSVASSGSPTPGQTLTGEPGTFAGGETYAYQWQLCSSGEVSSCVSIPGAEALTYTPNAEEAGSFLRFVVTASNLVLGTSAAPQPSPAAVLPCVSRRVETIHWKVPGGAHLKRVLVSVNSSVYRRLPASARSVAVSLAGRAAGKFTVLIAGVGRGGKRYVASRTYETCTTGVSHGPVTQYLKRG